MVTRNKVPANWPAALKMADDIAELIKEFRWRHHEGLPDVDKGGDAIQVLDLIAKLVGMEDE